jgi:hypothetical protein
MTNVAASTNADRIRLLNDNFRSTFVGGQVVMTRGVADLPLEVQARLILAVQSFSNSRRTMTRTASTTSARSTLRENATSSSSITTRRTSRRAPTTRRPRKDGARAYHHARR